MNRRVSMKLNIARVYGTAVWRQAKPRAQTRGSNAALQARTSAQRERVAWKRRLADHAWLVIMMSPFS